MRYFGKKQKVGHCRVFVCIDETFGSTLLKHVVRHSPDGFQWGDGGSGPADLALSILTDYNNRTNAVSGSCLKIDDIYQEFKKDFISNAGNDLSISSESINEWLNNFYEKERVASMETKLQLRSLSNEMWSYMIDNVIELGRCLRDSSIKDVHDLYFKSLKLIILDLGTNKDIYKDYPPNIYSEEDFVDMIIESIGEKVPDDDKLKENEIYNNEIRAIAWGHIKTKYKEMLSLLRNLSKEEIYDIRNEDIHLLRECLTVIFVESLLRKRELQLLENSIRHD